MSNQTALRTNPEVLRALQDVLGFEKDEELRKVISNVLKQSSEKFMPELISALKAEKHATVPMVSGDPKPTKEQIDDILTSATRDGNSAARSERINSRAWDVME